MTSIRGRESDSLWGTDWARHLGLVLVLMDVTTQLIKAKYLYPSLLIAS